MVLVAGPPVPVGSFILLSRPPEWGEVMIGAFTDNYSHAVCKTTNSIGDAWMRLPTSAAHWERRAPAGIPDGDINWVCTPPTGATQWRPGVAEIPNICAMASEYPRCEWAIGGDHRGWCWIFWTSSRRRRCFGRGGRAGSWRGEPGRCAFSRPSGTGGSAGFAAVGCEPRGSLQCVKEEQEEGSQEVQEGFKEEEKEEEGQEAFREQLQQQQFIQQQHLQVPEFKEFLGRQKEQHGKDRSVSCSDLTHVDALKLKRKGDLLAFASRHPGALTAHFLAGVYSRLSKGSLTRTGQLRDVSVGDLRPQGGGHPGRSAGLHQPKRDSIQSAKQKGGSWEKAEAVDTRKSLASSGMLALTNA